MTERFGACLNTDARPRGDFPYTKHSKQTPQLFAEYSTPHEPTTHTNVQYTLYILCINQTALQAIEKDRRASQRIYNNVGYFLTLSDGFDAVGGGGGPLIRRSST